MKCAIFLRSARKNAKKVHFSSFFTHYANTLRSFFCIFAVRVQSGEYRVESGEWRVQSGEYRVESTEWRVESGEWRVESGEYRALTILSSHFLLP